MWDAETRGSLFIVITNVRLFLKTCFYQWKVVFFPSPIIYLLLKFFIVFLYRKYYSRISKISWRSLFFSFAIFVVSIYSFRGNFILISVVKYFKWIVHFRLCNCVVLLFNCPFLWKKARINNNVAFQNCFSCYFLWVFLLPYLLLWKWWCCLSES